MMLNSFRQVRETMLHPSMRSSSICNTQHIVTHVAPNSVAICGVEMFRTFGRGFTDCWYRVYATTTDMRWTASIDKSIHALLKISQSLVAFRMPSGVKTIFGSTSLPVLPSFSSKWKYRYLTFVARVALQKTK